MLRYLTLAALLVATSLAHPDYSDTWEEFKQKYEKEYESEDEEVKYWTSNGLLQFSYLFPF